MDLLYTTHRRAHSGISSFTETQQNFELFCTTSTCNVLAFTTNNELTEPSPIQGWGFHIYVADLNTPWFPYKVASNKYPVTVLQWDVQGRFLLVGDRNGNVQIYAQKDHLLSEWKPVYSVRFPGENILAAVFFHNGRKMSLQTEKKDQFLYLEKFQKSKFVSSVRQFGGVPVEGVLIVTATGMLGAFIIPSESNANIQKLQEPMKLTPVTESLGVTRNFYTSADICYSKAGHFMIAVGNGDTRSANSSMVLCFRVTVKKIDESLEINSSALPSFFVSEGFGKDLKELRVAHVRWAFDEDPDSLIVASNHSGGGSFVEHWELTEETTPIHKLFQGTKSEPFKTLLWVSKNQYRYNTKVVKIATTRLNFLNNSFVYLSMSDNSVHCLQKEMFKRIACTNIVSIRDPNDHSNKQIRLGVKIGAIVVSYLGHLFVALDTFGQLYVYRCSFMCQDQLGTPALIVQTVNLLEYCLVTGLDCLDILLTLKTQILENILERLTENFHRQPSNVQQYYYVNFLTMKIALYRLSIPGQQKAHDLSNLLILHSILVAFKSLLRPSDLTSHDKGPAENLAMVLSESVPDVDKVLLNLEAKDFTVERPTLQSLQQLIQWVADLALNILAKLPENRSFMSNKSQGYDISKDIIALNSIRELLVMIRIWGLLNPQCLPVFSRSADNLDILLTLFRLLTKLSLNPNEPDDLLLDECCLLPNQVLIPQLQFVPSRTMIASPLLPHVNLPVMCEYGVENESLKFCPEVPIVEGGLSNDNVIDSVMYLQLGRRPPSLRRCTRCGSCSSVVSVAKTAAMKAWEQRWIDKCRCNGFWRLEVS
ncbi:mediator of RNA polymerase II transcription subunit 16 [Uranotaenia lowii]|uniref:mediator of RNA polymerase II transcription subunit 16 n=1 Tax=Uranotaenia lowii TaxID=190385 RepID=UPI002479832A|nr:mediator of RNA polymerase II transcription subunit 16 [Uranotaenia lowii]XP_055614107.1 mediator of RNA polymerase II transcription subunit 16 [Uranotaenia lowii]XP_055614108.1 mediator of RNA polymerase II transcription subunit 16 [Uranotaenia lowii]